MTVEVLSQKSRLMFTRKLVRGVGFGPQFTSTYKQIPQKKFRQGLVVLLGYVIACFGPSEASNT
ncbi:hypothetical protein AUF78_04255 [archaeon 13_1_20CM_2_51_12]|nr:MAG: hypothetical protein AUF78_04255 [archaeon 13_1_20CM_2_51_12]